MAEGHWVAISGHVGIGLDLFRHGYCHKFIDNTVEERQRRASARLCWRDRQPSFSSIAVTLDLVLKPLVVQRDTLFWIFSIWSTYFLEEGSHMGEAYFSLGRTRVL